MKFPTILATLCCIASLSTAVDINCIISEPQNGDYTCEMINNDINKDSPLSKASAEHYDDEAIKSRVKILSVTTRDRISTLYLPTKVCSYFTSLETFDVSATLLNALSRNNFADCQGVKTVKVINSGVSWLAEDVFVDLVELIELSLTSNHLVFLPVDLFINNQKLQSIDFSHNKLMVIYMVLPKSVTQLNLLDNNCIHRSGESKNSVDSLVDSYQERCKDATFNQRKYKNLLEQSNKLNTTIEQYKTTIHNLQTERDQCYAKNNETSQKIAKSRQETSKNKSNMLHEVFDMVNRNNQLAEIIDTNATSLVVVKNARLSLNIGEESDFIETIKTTETLESTTNSHGLSNFCSVRKVFLFVVITLFINIC